MHKKSINTSKAKIVIGDHEIEVDVCTATQYVAELYKEIPEDAEEFFVELASSHWSKVRAQVAELPNITKTIFDMLIDDHDHKVRLTLLNNHCAIKYLTDHHVQSLIDENQVSLISGIALHLKELKISKRMKAQLREFILNHPDPQVRVFLLYSNDIELDEIEKLTEDSDPFIRREVSKYIDEE